MKWKNEIYAKIGLSKLNLKKFWKMTAFPFDTNRLSLILTEKKIIGVNLSKILISCDQIVKKFPDKIVSNNNTFGIHENDKIALIGVNGCGKTTLLKMIFGIEPPDSGQIIFRNNITVSYLPQNPNLNDDLTIKEQIYQIDSREFEILRKWHSLSDELALNYSETLQTELDEINKLMDSLDVWKYEININNFLTKLGITEINQKISTLSGGQKRRVDLARVLANSPDILILDEPTNHLDINTIEWLQNYLADYKGTLLFVTHDRYFLDVISNKIMEIENGNFKFYHGNYSYYLEKKQNEFVDLQRKETRRNAQLKKELKWLNRGARARSSKPKNHLDRVKELLSKSYLTENAEMSISFQSQRLGKTILELKNVSKTYSGKELFKPFSHNFQKLERIGIIGDNGSGKTTLLKMITGDVKPDTGSIKVGLNTKFAYFRQNVNDFNENISVEDYIKRKASNIRTADGILHSASEMLEKFLFTPKMQRNKISSLSGGEQKRLYLLSSLMFGANFMILDEPTNDLDIQTLEILEDYLDAFKGCLLIVSHDRYFLDRVTDYLFIFEDRIIKKFSGNYSDYLLVKKFQKEEKEQKENKSYKKNKLKTKLSYNEEKELESLTAEMESLELEIENLKNKMENEAQILSYQEFDELSKILNQKETKLESVSEKWLELEEKKESLSQQ